MIKNVPHQLMDLTARPPLRVALFGKVTLPLGGGTLLEEASWSLEMGFAFRALLRVLVPVALLCSCSQLKACPLCFLLLAGCHGSSAITDVLSRTFQHLSMHGQCTHSP